MSEVSWGDVTVTLCTMFECSGVIGCVGGNMKQCVLRVQAEGEKEWFQESVTWSNFDQWRRQKWGCCEELVLKFSIAVK